MRCCADCPEGKHGMFVLAGGSAWQAAAHMSTNKSWLACEEATVGSEEMQDNGQGQQVARTRLST